MFSCEFCEISKNTFFYRTPLVAASQYIPAQLYQLIFQINFKQLPGSYLNRHQATQRDRMPWKRVWKKIYVTDFNTLIGKLENINEINANLY